MAPIYLNSVRLGLDVTCKLEDACFFTQGYVHGCHRNPKLLHAYYIHMYYCLKPSSHMASWCIVIDASKFVATHWNARIDLDPIFAFPFVAFMGLMTNTWQSCDILPNHEVDVA